MKSKFGLYVCLAISISSHALFGQESLPLPPAPFEGKVGETYKDSKSEFPPVLTPPKDAPNVLIILIDDLGFAGTSAFGGLVPTPNIDKLGASGLRYNRFHTTALCSPTRAALLSGRNHHQVGMAGITEGATGFPGYNSVWGQDCAAIGEVLRYRGYTTAAFGKWHDTPDWETSPAGPFDRWPTGKGFDFFYGFQGGETNQYYPQLFRNNSPVEPTKSVKKGYILNTDLADQATTWLHQQEGVAPDRPWFLYYAPGAMHAPHHAPKEYIDRFRGKFDMGWDKYRDLVLERQIKAGIIPPDAKATARPAEMPAWEAVSADEKKLYARQMEVFAGFLAHTDAEIGRVLDAVHNGPHADNTLIVAILGDNGCSAEGGLHGTLNNMATQNGFPDDVPSMLGHLEELGGPLHENHFSVCWAWAIDTPFQWTKQVASHFGGTRTGMILNWPARIKAHGEIRSQFHHVVDIAPTIYEAAKIDMPKTVNGIEQTPLAGVSMVYTFDEPAAKERHTTQYFEIFGNRGIYHNGWMASARHGVPWVLMGKDGNFSKDRWELYDLTKDFSQADDVAAKNPEKMKEMEAAFRVEAEKYQVLPLDDRFAERAQVADRPTVGGGRSHFSYFPGTVRIPEGSAPNVKARSHKITASFEMTGDGTEGVLVAAGGSAGYSLFVKGGKLMYENNFFGKERDLIATEAPLGKGKIVANFEYIHESKQYGGGGTARLSVNGGPPVEKKFAHVPPARYGATESFDIGMDLGEPASNQYEGPFAFTGTINKIDFEVQPSGTAGK